MPTKEEIALPLQGKKSNLKKTDLIDYFAYEKLGLDAEIASDLLQTISTNLSIWKNLINSSFLSDEMKKRYLELLEKRLQVLGLS